MKGSPIRQDYLETVISWISKGKINEYMGKAGEQIPLKFILIDTIG